MKAISKWSQEHSTRPVTFGVVMATLLMSSLHIAAQLDTVTLDNAAVPVEHIEVTAPRLTASAAPVARNA